MICPRHLLKRIKFMKKLYTLLVFNLAIVTSSIAQVPTITNFTPTSGAIGTSVTIAGTNFDVIATNNIVFFGATKATVTAATTTSLTVTVPVGATYQPITVTVGGLTAYSAEPFIVTFLLTFTGVRGIDVNSFAAKTEYTPGSEPWSVSIGDLDGDGKADLAVGNIGSSTVSVFLNNSTSPGTISYADKKNFTIAPTPSTAENSLPTSIAIGDLDGDGKLDLAVANEAAVISVLRNISSGVGNIDFASKVDLGTTGYAASVSIFDIDKDGKPDLAAATSSGLSIFHNVSNSVVGMSFSPEAEFVTGKNTVSVSISDLDGDGLADFAVANSSDGFSVFRNTSIPGTISCDAAVNFISTGTSPWSVSSGDFSNDGKPDLALVNNSAGINENVKVFRNTSTGIGNFSFAQSVDLTITSGTPMGSAIGDIDGDGKLDLVVGGGNGNVVSLFRNKGVASETLFFSQVDFAIGANARSVSIGDLDGDGKADLAVAGGIFSSTNVVAVLRNTVSSPTINSFSPSLGKVGTEIIISGVNFSTTPADNVVKFNGTTATVSASTATSITTSVPTSATKGKITVTVGSQTATSLTDFIVTPQITESFVTTYNKGAQLTVSITVDNAANASAVNFKSRGISEAVSALKSAAITATGNKFEATVPVDKLTDPIGLTYWFEVLDQQTIPVAVNSTTGKAYVKYALADQEVPLSFGNQISNYQIIAVPLDLTDKSVTNVFKSLIPYDKTKWRLFDYASGDNREYSAFSTIDPGKGYWLIVKTSTTINPGEGTTVQADDAAPFTINLAVGWNLIGNPYNFNVLWSEVMSANPTATGVVDSTLTTFSKGTLSSDATVLERYRGAFVKSTGAVTLKIPVTRNSSINGGRIPNKTEHLASIDQENWEIKLTLEQNGLRNEMGGIGMNAKALSGKDQFDGVSFSLPFDICALSHPHPGVSADFYKEVVPTHENFTWQFDVKRSLPGNIEMTWNNDYFGDNDKQLMLLDPASLQVIDMKTNNSVTLAESTKKIKILYGSKDYIQSSLDKELPWLGSPYPNPAQGEVSIPFRVPETADQANVQIKVYNGQGLEAGTVIDAPFAKGSYEVKWMPSSASGLYLIRMQLGHGEAKTTKLIIK